MKRYRNSSRIIKNATANQIIGPVGVSGTFCVTIKITNRIRRYMELAKNSAFNSDFCHRHGSVLARGGAVIHTSFNKAVFNSFADRFRSKQDGYGSRHAEIGAVFGMSRSATEGSDVYVARVNNKGEFCNSCPCSMCIDICRFVGVKRIIFSIDEETVGVVKL